MSGKRPVPKFPNRLLQGRQRQEVEMQYPRQKPRQQRLLQRSLNRENLPSEVDSYSDLPDFSGEVATVREVDALPATASGGEAIAEAAPAQAKAPTQVVG